MSDQKEFESLSSDKKAGTTSGNLFSENLVDSNQDNFNISDDDFDAKMWEEQHVSTFPSILKAIIVLALLFAVVLFLYKFAQSPQSNIESLNTEMSAVPNETLSDAPLEPEVLAEENVLMDSDASMDDLPQDTQDAINEFLEREKAALKNNESIIGDTDTSKVRSTADGTAQSTSAALAAATPANVVKQSSSENAQSQNATATQELTAKKITAEKTTVKPTAAKLATEKKAVEAQVAQSTAQKTSAKTAASSSVSLKGMNSNVFAVQLIGMNDTESFNKFVAALPKDLSVHTYQRTRQGKAWNVAVLAPYATADEARAAIDKLPENLKAQKPWIRSLAVIKQEL